MGKPSKISRKTIQIHKKKRKIHSSKIYYLKVHVDDNYY